MVFKTGRRSGIARKSIRVFSNDPETPKLTLTIKGEILVDIAAKPRTVVFRKLQVGQESTQKLRLDVRKPEEVKITKISVDHELFEVKKVDEEGNYEVTFAGMDKVGSMSSRILVEYTGGDKPSITIPMRAMVEGDLTFPRSFSFKKNEGVFEPHDIVITSKSGKPVEITGITDKDGLLSTEITTNKAPKAVIKAVPKDPKASFPTPSRHSITIFTSDKYQPEIVMRYSLSDVPLRNRGRGDRKRKLPSPLKPEPVNTSANPGR